MPQEDYKLKTEVEIANLELEEQTPQVQETIAELKASLEKEVEETVADFKAEDNQVKEIEETVNLNDPKIATDIESNLQINKSLEDLDKKADELKNEVILEKSYDQREKEVFIEFNKIISEGMKEYNISFDELLEFEGKSQDEKKELPNYEDYQKIVKQLDHIDINDFIESKDLNVNNISLITNNDVRKFLVGHILEKIDLPHEKLLILAENSQDIIPLNNKDKFINIKESFYVLNNREALPLPILEVLNKFENHYGTKGSNLISLAITAYGTKNPELF